MGFAKLLDRATCDGLLEPDLQANLDIVDTIRSGDISAQDALKAIRKRLLTNRNPSVTLMTLTVLEMVVKNCGSPVQSQIATKEFMDEFTRFIKGSIPLVRTRCLEILQTWELAFRREPKYRVVPDAYNILRAEGFQFPPVNVASGALFVAESAPEWAEGDVCYACRSAFSYLTNRQHHCRNCGQVFCQKCSSKTSTIPRFGIEKDVRVCDHCFEQLKKGDGSAGPAPLQAASLAAARHTELTPEEEVARAIEQNPELAVPVSKAAPRDREAQLKEQEEMELALALSMSEAETKGPSMAASAPSALYNHFDVANETIAGDDPMVRYLQQSQRQPAAAVISMAAVHSTSQSTASSKVGGALLATSGPSAPPAWSSASAPPVLAPKDLEFLKEMRQALGLFEQRLERASARGAGISGDLSLQSLFRSLSLMHPELLSRIEQLEGDKQGHEDLLRKQELVRRTRAHAQEIERQHQEKLEQQRLEQETLRQMQLHQKLKLIEQQEKEKLAYQRALDEQRQQALLEEQRRSQEIEHQRQQAAFEREQQRLQEQQAELERRRVAAERMRQEEENRRNALQYQQQHPQYQYAHQMPPYSQPQPSQPPSEYFPAEHRSYEATPPPAGPRGFAPPGVQPYYGSQSGESQNTMRAPHVQQGPVAQPPISAPFTQPYYPSPPPQQQQPLLQQQYQQPSSQPQRTAEAQLISFD